MSALLAPCVSADAAIADAAIAVAARDDAILRRCFARARGHRFYRDVHIASDDHRSAAPLEKQTLLDALSGFQPGHEGKGVYLVRSGGSTHAPLVFPVDIAENMAQRQALAKVLSAAGVFGPRTVALNVFGYADLYRSASIMDDILERCEATTLAMSAHARYEDLYDTACRFAPTHLLGTPSKLTLFAHFIAGRGQRLDIPQLLYAGEVLRPSARALFAEHFGTQRIWSLYGGAETGIWAWSDASARPGLFDILPEVVVEILSPDADGFGSIAVTNAYRARFPVFRYRLGDVGRWVERDGTRYLELRGRDSRSFQFDELTFDLDPIAALAADADVDVDADYQLQLHSSAHGRDRCELLLVRGAGSSDDRLRQVGAQLAAMLQHDVNSEALRVMYVDRDALHIDTATAKTPALVDFRS